MLKQFFKKYSTQVSGKVVVDFGSGKGRILIMAMKYGAKKVIGVEFAKELVDISTKNINRYIERNKIKSDYEIIWDDATNYVLSHEESVFFFYNPFDETIMQKVLDKIERARNEILIAYVNPVSKDLFKSDMFEQIDDFGNGELIVYRNKVE